MKKRKRVLLLFSMLPSLIIAAFIPFLPVKVPMHYDSSGAIDRWGNKFELFIVTTLFLIIGIVFYFTMQRYKNEQDKQIWALYDIINGFMSILIFRTLITAMTSLYQSPLSLFSYDLIGNRTVFLGAGLFFLLFSHKFQYIPKNSFIGIRVYWAEKSEESWKKCHIILSNVFSKIGFFMILGTLLVPLEYSLSYNLVLIFIGAILTLGISFKSTH